MMHDFLGHIRPSFRLFLGTHFQRLSNSFGTLAVIPGINRQLVAIKDGRTARELAEN